MTIPANGDWADEAAYEILSDLDGRAGMSMCDIDDEIMDEIRATAASIIRGCAEHCGLLPEKE